ncbi:MAG TPA: cellulose-binding domain-containing protein [Streptosporangiaceae bacterium]|nr:cellulose-binding domain-containing protein [Streptosporangiaceae bacterium]
MADDKACEEAAGEARHRTRLRPGIRRLSAAAATMIAGTAVLGAALIAGWSGAAPAAAACRVDYTVNQWATGFTAQVNVTNNAAAVTSWTLTWTFAGDQQVASAWNSQVTQNARSVTARDAGYNGTLGTGASTNFGFQATYSGQNAIPTDFALNGTPCGDITPTRSATASPTVSQSVSPTIRPTDPICSIDPCDDSFEGQTGTTPTGPWQPSFPDCQGTGAVAVDHAVAHTGSTSLRIDGGPGYCNHAFALNTTMVPGMTTGRSLYVRMFVRHTTALPDGHVTFAALTDAADGNRHLRLGGQNRALQWNRESDDATLPEQSPAGVALSAPLPVDQWSCLEFNIDGAQGTMTTWLDGTEVQGLHLDQTPTGNIDSQWLSRSNWHPSPIDLRLGWESYAGGTDTLWFDDIGVYASRLGC